MTLETASEVSSIKSGDFPTNDPQLRFCSEAGAGPRPCDQEAPAHESDDGARRNTNVFDTFRPREAPKAGGSCGQEDEPRKPGWKSAAVKKQRPAGLQRVSSVKCSKSKKGGQQITEKETYIVTVRKRQIRSVVNRDMQDDMHEIEER